MNARRIRRKYLILTALLLALPVLLLVEERIRGEWRLAAWTSAMRARGEKLTIEELTPPPPTGSNVFILTPAEAERLFSVGYRMADEAPSVAATFGPGRAVVSWRRDRWLDDDGRVYTWTDYLRVAGPTRKRLPGLRQQLTNRIPRVELDYGRGLFVLLPHLTPAKRAAQALCDAAIYDLRERDLAGALANLHAAALLADSMQTEVIMVSQLTRIGISRIAQSAIWEALQADGWQDTQLARLQADWQAVHFTPEMIHALAMERATEKECFPRGRLFAVALFTPNGLSPGGGSWFGSGRQGTGVYQRWIKPAYAATRFQLWQHVWAASDEYFYSVAMQEVIDSGRHAWTNRNLAALCALNQRRTNLLGAPLLLNRLDRPGGLGWRYQLSEMFLPVTVKPLLRAATEDAWNQVMVAAIALKRFQVRYGRWPATLDALVPDFLAAVPVDWMDGQPLRYRLREDGGYLLYSVGEDGIDQGGDPAPPDPHSSNWRFGRDFVWPQAATQEAVATADAEVAAKAAQKPKRHKPATPKLDVEMMKRYGLLPPDYPSK